MRLTRKMKWITAATGALTFGIAGTAAFAYFTANGSGTGSASVGNATPIALSATTADNLFPDGPGVDVTITVANNGDGAQHVGSVTLASIDADAGHASCATTVPTAFSMPAVAVNATIAAHSNTQVHGTLSMHDTGSSQNNCQGASLTLNLTSN
jgi:hypothetical protein